MGMVVKAAAAPDPRTRGAAFEALHRIAMSYYRHLPAYMPELFNITVAAVRRDQEDVALQAIEFWCTLCDYELEVAEDPQPDDVNHAFIPQARRRGGGGRRRGRRGGDGGGGGGRAVARGGSAPVLALPPSSLSTLHAPGMFMFAAALPNPPPSKLTKKPKTQPPNKTTTTTTASRSRPTWCPCCWSS